MDLQDPTSKMSTTSSTEAGLVYIDEEPDAIMRKLKRAQTDSGSEVVRGPDKAGIGNLIEVLAVIRGITPEEVESEFAGQGYGAFKAAVGEAVVDLLTPVRERYLELRADEPALEAVLQEGAGQAREIATGVMEDVRAAMGVGPQL
jgi:tryptophanyl-tRNA synthetase